MINKIEEGFKQFYTSKNCRGISTVFTPKIVRDKMTIHAKPEMKILVMFNFEFCYDLNKMGCKDVMFVSDDELRNKIVEETWGYMTEFIEPRDINKKLKGMKFDLIVSNPPYNKGLDLKILESVLELSDNICFVHPIGWLMRDKQREIKKHLKSVDIYDGHDIFNIYNNFPVGITHLNGQNKNFKVNDYSHWFSKKNEFYINDTNIKLKPYSWYSEIRQIEEKLNVISFKDKFHSIDKGKGFGVPLIRGHLKTPDFCTLVQNKFEPHWNKEYRLGYHFDNEKIARNCYEFLKTKFARFCISMTKLDFHVTLDIPWFDFSKAWTDEECAKELGLTNKELLWIIQQIPNYYPEDVETYRKLEEKLEEQLKN